MIVQSKIKSYAKINLALNIIKKNLNLHKIETIVAFISLFDEIYIKQILSNKHKISFTGQFSKKIGKDNTISKLLKILERKGLLKDKKFKIKIKKNIPSKAGLGGGSMNASSILNFFIKKKIIKSNKKEVIKISNEIGSDVILGLNPMNSILYGNNQIKYFSGCEKFYLLIVKPNFGCSTKEIYSKVKKIDKKRIYNPGKRMFNLSYLKRSSNSLERIVLSKHANLMKIKLFLETLPGSFFARMTGSGSALIAYFKSKKGCEKAKIKFRKKHKNYWCITSKTI